ncbi:hypothetical protein QBC35DRAFT_455557 [Podospora australis]|uniref:Uncharacterized protein n=1 Tax=Podospora australis TaxID=1536484 RepID=A0AAN6WPT4_9PEZI|nr:hypothetical protein QBC35DRAFT_455557 [Podospora australis]
MACAYYNILYKKPHTRYDASSEEDSITTIDHYPITDNRIGRHSFTTFLRGRFFGPQIERRPSQHIELTPVRQRIVANVPHNTSFVRSQPPRAIRKPACSRPPPMFEHPYYHQFRFPVMVDQGPQLVHLQPVPCPYGAAFMCPRPDAPPPYFNYHASGCCSTGHLTVPDAATQSLQAPPPAQHPYPKEKASPAQKSPVTVKPRKSRSWIPFSRHLSFPRFGHSKANSDSAITHPSSTSISRHMNTPPVFFQEGGVLNFNSDGDVPMRHSENDRRVHWASPPNSESSTTDAEDRAVSQSASTASSSDTNSMTAHVSSMVSDAPLGSLDNHSTIEFGESANSIGGNNRTSRSPYRRSSPRRSRYSSYVASEDITLSRLHDRRSGHRSPRPDIYFPSPERRRPRISFARPRNSDDVFSPEARESRRRSFLAQQDDHYMRRSDGSRMPEQYNGLLARLRALRSRDRN